MNERLNIGVKYSKEMNEFVNKLSDSNIYPLTLLTESTISLLTNKCFVQIFIEAPIPRMESNSAAVI